MEKLISMTDFVLEQSKTLMESYKSGFNIEKYDFMIRTIEYARFLKQPLELWMFVPCDENNNPLKEPTMSYSQENIAKLIGFEIEIAELVNRRISDYQYAKKRCLFEGFKFCESQREGIQLGLKLFISPYNSSGKIYLTKKKESGYHSWFQLFTIEDLVQCELTLTPNALKQIGL
jgi:hypothetical protein